MIFCWIKYGFKTSFIIIIESYQRKSSLLLSVSRNLSCKPKLDGISLGSSWNPKKSRDWDLISSAVCVSLGPTQIEWNIAVFKDSWPGGRQGSFWIPFCMMSIGKLPFPYCIYSSPYIQKLKRCMTCFKALWD